ncbi:MAG: glycosyltransferase family 1 protein [bacterium]
MKIGIDGRTLTRDSYGIGVYTKKIIENLLEIDQANEYYVFFDSPDIPAFNWLSSRVKAVYVPFPGVSRRPGNNYAAPFWENISLPFFLKRLKIDAYLGSNFMIPLITGVPGVVVVHGMAPFVLHGDEEPWLWKKYFCAMVRLSTLKARKIITVSQDVKNDLIKYLGTPAEKITVVRLAYDPLFQVIKDQAFLSEIKAKYNLPDKFFFFVGGLSARKNLINMLRAFSILKRKYNVPHKLVLAGGQWHGAEAVLAEVEKLDLKVDVFFLGVVPHDKTLAGLYNLADFYVAPSFHEAFNLPVVEAIACGCPVILADIPAHRENIGEAAYYGNHLDVEAWSKTIFNAIENTALRHEMVAKGLIRAKTYSWEKTARETLKVIESLKCVEN